jgi:hypothetical protein
VLSVIDTVFSAAVPVISDEGDSVDITDPVTEEDGDPVEVDEPRLVEICADSEEESLILAEVILDSPWSVVELGSAPEDATGEDEVSLDSP